MSSNSSQDAQMIELLVNASAQVSRYFPVIIFFVGTIGNILNILTLSQRTLGQMPCIFFFLISSICSLISIDFGLITRVLSGWTVDPTYTIGWFCKLRTFIVFSSRAMVFWLIVLATIDRWLTSSVQIHRRQLSTIRNARRETLFVIIVSMIIYSQLFYCYDANLVNAPFKCYAKTHACQLVADMTFACFTTIVPIVVMLIFGLMTIVNIRQSQRRILNMATTTTNPMVTASNETQNRSKKVERHLLRMVFVQVIVLAVLTVPQAVQRLYSVFVATFNSQLEATIDMFVYNIVLLLTYLGSAMPFYIYTLAGGSLFRKALYDLIKGAFRSILCRH
ncbi:hypothetical protein I4U23_016252 [Adineta vaga]|nr:hypothetical protein I4U23_016252 [Adineta vaga]